MVKKVVQYRRLTKLVPREHMLFKSFQINKFINKFVKNGNKLTVEKHVYKAFSNVKNQLKVYPSKASTTPGLILLQAVNLLKLHTILVKYHTRKQSRMKRAKKARYIPVPVKPRRQHVLAFTLLTKLILFQKKTQRRDTHINKYYINKAKVVSVSKKRGFEDRFHVSLPGQKLDSLITAKFLELHKTNYAQIFRYKMRYFVKIVNRRAFMHFRWA
jgi:ribosomal protein S7